jgi:hypothetical protein
LDEDYLTIQSESFFSKLIRNLFYKKSRVLFDNSNVISFNKVIHKSIPDYLKLGIPHNEVKTNQFYYFNSLFNSGNGFHKYFDYNIAPPCSSLNYYYPNDMIKGSKQIMPLILRKINRNITSEIQFRSEINNMVDLTLNEKIINYVLVNVTMVCLSLYGLKLLQDGYAWIKKQFNYIKRPNIICLKCNENLNNIICVKCMCYYDYCSNCFNETLDNKEMFLSNKEMFHCKNYKFGIFKCNNKLSKGYLVE